MSEEDEAAAEATDEQEADAYVQRVLAELELEERSRPLLPPASSPHPPAASAPEKHTRLGVSPPPDSALDLALPSVPTAPPLTSAREPTAVFSDAEIDSWCIVCSDDAGVKCLGCDGDLYCAACWKEGHVGPDAGMEERGHRWARFTKPATTR
ncbi:MAG: hypothetical protein M1832_006318 [Thelocarpon impressellum]|nr:MAG: hypothetical protein M1832_006318 [Thelocarpon impressellum]